MKIFKLLVCLSFLTLLLSNCTKDNVVPKKDYQKLFGRWDLVHTTLYYGIYTPTATDNNRQIEYKRNGVFNQFVFDHHVASYRYDIEQTQTSFYQEKIFVINYEQMSLKNKWRTFLTPNDFNFIGNDTLVLTDLCYDCGYHTYVRVK